MVPPDRLVAQVLEETRASQDKMEIQVHQDQLDQLGKEEILETVDSLGNQDSRELLEMLEHQDEMVS